MKLCYDCKQPIEHDDNMNYFHLPPMLRECDITYPFPIEEILAGGVELDAEEARAFENNLNFSAERIDELQHQKVVQFRSEELLLEKIYERLCSIKPKDGEWNECLDALWDIIEEHNDNNQWKLRK